MMIEAHARRHRFSVADIERMLKAGLLHDARLELIDGELLEMNAQGPTHAGLTTLIREHVRSVYGSDFHVRDHSPLATSDHDLPEPDIAVVRGSVSRYMVAYPRGTDAVLVIEIAATTLRHDRAKARVYARGGVQEYWIVDIEGRRLEVHRKPDANGDYAVRLLLDEHESVSWPDRDGAVDVRALLPPAG